MSSNWSKELLLKEDEEEEENSLSLQFHKNPNERNE